MRILGIIPSRYASSRFPGKPLVDILGKSMIQRVYEQAAKSTSLTDLIIATDDQRIYDHVDDFGGNVMMTSFGHKNGTERCGEVVSKLEREYDFVINIQGDEPFISPQQIDTLATSLDRETELATQVKFETDQDLYESPNEVKVVFDSSKTALYFSRSPIPMVKNPADFQGFYKHVGIYAYRLPVLNEIIGLPASPLELSESLEQLRWLENGYRISIVETNEDSISIDSPEDLERVLSLKSAL